jgi:hypothetical protein
MLDPQKKKFPHIHTHKQRLNEKMFYPQEEKEIFPDGTVTRIKIVYKEINAQSTMQ